MTVQSMITKAEGKRELPFDRERLDEFIARNTGITDKAFNDKIERSITANERYKASNITELLIQTALENVDEVSTHWTFDAARIFLARLYKQASRNRAYDAKQRYGDFYGLLKVLAGKGVYSPAILEKYSREEIKELSRLIAPERDLLFDYPGLHMLAGRYLAADHAKNVYELPQERWLIIAMHLMQDEEPARRAELVGEAYWALSNLYMTVATPTLANAGLAHGQLSSCFIDTVEDSLIGIYNSNTDVARLSKDGGGIGQLI